MEDTTHACPGCTTARVARSKFACPSCWRRLPRDLQVAITRNYGVDMLAHVLAMSDAKRWYRENR